MTNSKNTKRALLSSALAILVCVAMLLGTTFAWFTDTASTSVNKIQAGTLDVALEMWNGEKWVDIEGDTISFVNKDGSGDILWEPGATFETNPIRIRNNGNLAFKYQVIITGIGGDAKLNEVIDWYYSIELSSVFSDAEGWTTPTDGYELDNFGEENFLFPAGTAANGRTDNQVFKIIGKMDATAGNEYQGLSIDGISITVTATQYTYENDINNNQYDEGAEYEASFWDGYTYTAPTADANGVYHITNAAEFAGYIKAVGASDPYTYEGARLDTAKAVLECNINLNGGVITRTGESYQFSGEFDGQGHTVSNFTIKRTDDNRYTGLFGYVSDGSVKNLTVKNATVIGGKQVAVIVPAVYDNGTVDSCHAIDCTVIGIKKVGAIAGIAQNATVSECSATNCNVFASETDVVEAGAGAVIGYAENVTGENTNTTTNVNIYTSTSIVSTAADLTAALNNGGTVVIANDIDMENAWTTVNVRNTTLTVEGSGHKITNLNQALINLYGGTLTINNLTVEDSNVTKTTTGLGAGIIVEQAQWANLYMNNCNVKNSTLTTTVDTRAAALAGYVIGGAEIKDCSVVNCTINNGQGSAAAVIGHDARQGGYIDHTTVSNCTVKGNNISTNDNGWRVGAVIGTVAGTKTTISGCTVENNVLTQTNGTASVTPGTNNMYGRVDSNTGAIEIK